MFQIHCLLLQRVGNGNIVSSADTAKVVAASPPIIVLAPFCRLVVLVTFGSSLNCMPSEPPKPLVPCLCRYDAV